MNEKNKRERSDVVSAMIISIKRVIKVHPIWKRTAPAAKVWTLCEKVSQSVPISKVSVTVSPSGSCIVFRTSKVEDHGNNQQLNATKHIGNLCGGRLASCSCYASDDSDRGKQGVLTVIGDCVCLLQFIRS